MKYNFDVKNTEILADIITPIQLYLKIRTQFSKSLLLESSDYGGKNGSVSYICFNPIASFVVDNESVTESFPDKTESKYIVKKGDSIYDNFNSYIDKFSSKNTFGNGFFGYSSYDSVQYFENVIFTNPINLDYTLPEINFSFYRNVIIFDHFHNKITITDNILDSSKDAQSNINEILKIIKGKEGSLFSFDVKNTEKSNLTDEQFIKIVKKGKESCFYGDVFQIVLSRQFSQQFLGDDFNVYRALRSINPSPYLFYFDYGSYKIFGSSPESQIIIDEENAYIDPIAGTFLRTGDDTKDAILAKELLNDKKETAEHIMLVDLARNDLSRNSNDVEVVKFKEIQYFSHVLHMVSKVRGKLNKDYNPIKIMADTFPAGTLSGAPKYKAMQLIDKYESQNRGIYGGCLGFIGLDKTINTAIIIRSFVSKNNTLYYQAGAGVVSESVEQNELEEVNNKLGALRNAIEMAVKL